MKITVEATLAAPIETVWRAYTTPEEIVQWNAASDDWHTTAATVDLRVGGLFSSRMEAKDGSVGFDFAGTYTKIVPHQLLAYAFGDRAAQVEFADGPDGVTVRVSFDAEMDNSIEQQRQGWQAILDNFARHVAQGQPLSSPDEIDAVMAVIAGESVAFWDKDFAAWAGHWVHAPYVRILGWWERGGVTVTEGWDTLSARIQEIMAANPEPNPTAAQVRRENINLRIHRDVAWLTFDQYGLDTGDLDMDMPGLSRETRILEKHGGQWKIVYVGWLLDGSASGGSTSQ